VQPSEPVRLLVVDDEPHIADLVATVARYEGWQAVTAGSGKAALAQAATADRIAGLTRGGDDYLVKPFSVEELMARLRAVLRRSTGVAHQAAARGAVLRVGDLTLDEDTREVRRGDGPPAELTPTEYELLRYLMRRSPAVLTKAQILDHVWEYDFGGRSNVVELVISHLRRKVDAGGGEPLIHTVRGVGYVVRQVNR
jgi:two-component system OmpR family response regulator